MTKLQQTGLETLGEQLRSEIAYGKAVRDMTTNDLAHFAEIPERTLQRHLQKPEEMKLSELYMIAYVLGLKIRITGVFQEVETA